MTRKVLLVQYPLGIDLSEADTKRIVDEKPQFICFPEYFFISREHPKIEDNSFFTRKYIAKIKRYSVTFDCTVIGGTMITMREGKYYNTCYIYSRGEELGYYDKINLFQNEKDRLSPGKDYPDFEAEGLCFGVMICADVFSQSAFRYFQSLGVQVIFIPTFSPYKLEDVASKHERDKKIYLNGASLSQSYLVKVCSMGSLYDKKAQGRSLLVSKDRIIMRVPPSDEQTQQLIFVELDFYG